MTVKLASPAGAGRRPPWSASIGSPHRPEDAIQRAVFDHIGAHGAPGLVAWHTPNGGKRNAVEAARFKAMAVRPGVSDLVAVHDGRIFALELEAPGGRPTEAQLEFIADMERAGDLDRALAVLESSIAAGAKAMTCACFAHRSRPRLEPPAISSGPDDDLGDFQ